MKRYWLIAAPLLLLVLSGCDGVRNVGNAAESMRSATEQMASKSKIAGRAREAHILADAQQMEDRAAERDPDAAARQASYEVRHDGTGWAVYDLTTGKIVRSGGQTQSSLSHQKADETAYELQSEENEARLRAAASGQLFKNH